MALASPCRRSTTLTGAVCRRSGCAHRIALRSRFRDDIGMRRAVGYVRVSTDMQAADGLSLDAQVAAIEQYCAAHGYTLVRVCKDVISGVRDQRPGLQEALATLNRGADMLIVLKFDRLSRSIKHFCELYERYFKSGEKSWWRSVSRSVSTPRWAGRSSASCWSLPRWSARRRASARARPSAISDAWATTLVACPTATRPSPPPTTHAFASLAEEPEQQAVLLRIKGCWRKIWASPRSRRSLTPTVSPAQGARWTKSLLYNLVAAALGRAATLDNKRSHSDGDVKERCLSCAARA